MPNLTTTITWVPVTERLPQPSWHSLLISSEIPTGADGYIEVGLYTQRGWMTCGGGRCDHPLAPGQVVTHWAEMPIGPEA